MKTLKNKDLEKNIPKKTLAENSLDEDHKLLVQWYEKNKRSLPWRISKDPYKIWLSEVMLQQTTVTAVIPYYDKFLNLFPTVQHLADAAENEVMAAWAGLGYYSRARNLHKAAKGLAENGFPKTAAGLLELPGFGPYTSRAVASIAFGEKVGVLDGNVIRVLSRRHGLHLEWWNNKPRQELQTLSDHLALLGAPEKTNQGLMELGATVCTPKKIMCILCPWSAKCVARKNDTVELLPLKKARKKTEIWVWKPIVAIKDKKVALIKNDYAPFLKNQLIFPGQISMKKNKPKDCKLRHSITHHDIFIQVELKKNLAGTNLHWVNLSELKKVNPSSLLPKVLEQVL
jgi:A/G-specific adenine glycosylase